MRFLQSKPDSKAGKSLLGSIVDVLKEGTQLDLAVAYWGHGAIDQLGVDGSKPTRIICDLLSGGCNPHEVGRFLQPPFKHNKDFEVRHLSGLHAKVYLTPTNVIVGSANASANGLGDEGEIGTIEAAIQTDSLEVLSSARTWFGQLWEQSVRINEALLEEARKVGNRTPGPATFIELLLNGRDLFKRRLSLVYITQNASRESLREFKKQAGSHYNAAELEGLSANELPFYQAGMSKATFEKNCQPGDYIFNCANQELSRIREPGAIEFSKDDCIILLDDRRKYFLLYDDARSEITRKVLITNDEKRIMKRAADRFLQDEKRSKDFAQGGCFVEDMPDEFFQIIQDERARRRV